MLKLIKHTTLLVFQSVFVGLGCRRLADVAQKADFWAILHYILYPNKMTVLNKISVLKDVLYRLCAGIWHVINVRPRVVPIFPQG